MQSDQQHVDEHLLVLSVNKLLNIGILRSVVCSARFFVVGTQPVLDQLLVRYLFWLVFSTERIADAQQVCGNVMMLKVGVRLESRNRSIYFGFDQAASTLSTYPFEIDEDGLLCILLDQQVARVEIVVAEAHRTVGVRRKDQLVQPLKFLRQFPVAGQTRSKLFDFAFLNFLIKESSSLFFLNEIVFAQDPVDRWPLSGQAAQFDSVQSGYLDRGSSGDLEIVQFKAVHFGLYELVNKSVAERSAQPYGYVEFAGLLERLQLEFSIHQTRPGSLLFSLFLGHGAQQFQQINPYNNRILALRIIQLNERVQATLAEFVAFDFVWLCVRP